MAIRRFAALVVCFGFYSTVSSEFLPTDYFRGFVGNVLDIEKTKNGTATFTIEDNIIANISTFQEWHLQGHITIVDGGIGENHVTFQYFIPEGSAVYFETRIYIPEDLEEMGNYTGRSEKEFQSRREHFARETEELAFMALGEYRSANKSRTEKFAFSFDDVILQCNGDSMWVEGKGNRIVEGGIDTNYQDVTLMVPEGIDSRHKYSCVWGKDFDETRRTSAVSKLRNKVFAAEQGEVFYQGCYSIMTNTSEVYQTFDGVIVDYDIENEWKNGNGSMTIAGGGVNFTFVDLTFDMDPHAFGTERSNFTVRTEV